MDDDGNEPRVFAGIYDGKHALQPITINIWHASRAALRKINVPFVARNATVTRKYATPEMAAYFAKQHALESATIWTEAEMDSPEVREYFITRSAKYFAKAKEGATSPARCLCSMFETREGIPCTCEFNPYKFDLI